MKKENGFTLIELLAVIVILAVIALIAVPKIIEILNKSRLSAAEDSTYGIVEAAESYIANFMLQNYGVMPNEDLNFSCSSEGCTLTNELTNYNTENLKTLEFKGKKPIGGAITISENGNKVNVYGLLINNFICNYGDGLADCIDSSDIGPTKEDPPSIQHVGVKAIVYLDPTDFAHKCTSENYNETNSATGTKTGCMKWYAYAEDDNTYTMILDHNTTDQLSWNSSDDNSKINEIIAHLDSDTQEWNRILNPRIISANEIATIVGNTGWKSETNSNAFHFEDLKTDVLGTQNCAQSANCQYAWLYDRTTANCTNYGCLNDATGTHSGYGYTTSTPVFNDLEFVWYVHHDGQLNRDGEISLNFYGIRPVITIPKSLIKV